MVFHNPLDLEYWLINVFAGSVDIFVFLSFIAISGLAAYFRMPNMVTAIMFVIFGIFMSSYIGGLYLVLVLLSGLVTFYSISKIFTK